MSNQCMGCQAGWPFEKSRYGFRHLVIGGYPYEGVACTAHLYGYPRCTECGHFDSEHVETEGWSECYSGSVNGNIPCNCGNNTGR